MDEMKIVSKFTREIISKILKTVVKKKYGYNLEIELNNMTVTIKDGNTHIHLDVDTELNKNELIKILNNIGL